MQKFLSFIVVLWFIFCTLACKESKPDFSGKVPVDKKAWVQSFGDIELPILYADSNLKDVLDSTYFTHELISQIIPDSILKPLEKSKGEERYHPIGKIEKKKDKFTYLLLLQSSKNNKKLITLVLGDEKSKYPFLGWKMLIQEKHPDTYSHSVSISREPTFIISREKVNVKEQTTLYTRNGWAFTSDSIFRMVITDTNEDLIKNNTILNPLDTLPQTQPLSGDYIKNKKNFISLRDSEKKNTYLFFLYFEKENGECIGELKGELNMVAPDKGIYQQAGDACVIEFNFNGKQLTTKETGSCGNYRGITCYIDDRYEKKIKSSSRKKSK
ncbi:MAG: hypothetical protein MUF12_05125 [Sediminibacterium sp.]|jgi:hypothetical protein|nr:hypothetical protein [Hydrotalea sp.]MCU0337226.1 hypothetical protein [Sediminibacterium sp.]